MGDIISLITNQFQLFLLVLVRTSGIFIFSPFFSSQNVPSIAKIGLTLAISILISMTITSPVDYSLLPLALVIFKELLVGIIIGFISYAFFSAFYVMGQIIDMKIGFGMANVIDPQNRVQIPLLGNFYYIFSFIIFLGINGHHRIILALRDSYSYIPINSFNYTESTKTLIIDILAKSFEIGLKLSLPIVVVIFLADIILGILSKTIPQLNVFVVGMPFKILIGLVLILVGIPIFFNSIDGILDLIINYIYKFIET
ncbi:MAG: flagellar type III secretion system protein FliR [Tissierellia bacterium]|nr:flagellar type III secretion system protein FliR [Tissierellia bacterium]